MELAEIMSILRVVKYPEGFLDKLYKTVHMNTIVSTAWLTEHISDSNLVIADTRWVNGDLNGGGRLYKEGHLPGAIFLDVDTVLADRTDLTRGRHPLPDPETFVRKLADSGIGRDSFIVAYDDANGSVAARLWWMMRWLGVNNAVVLDGGIQKWKAEGRPIEAGEGRKPERHPAPLPPAINQSLFVEMKNLEADRNSRLLIDARAGERYRGEVEPIDKRAGHIPGAININFKDNLADGNTPVFRDATELRALYGRAGIDNYKEVVCYCGSGVTACHDLLALSIAGFETAKLYPGSWSEWICHHEAEVSA